MTAMPSGTTSYGSGARCRRSTESTSYRTPALKVRGKGFARLRTEAEGLLVLLCRLEEKEALLASGDPAFTTTAHYDGYGADPGRPRRIDRSDRLAS